MRALIRGNYGTLRRSFSFTVSVLVHGLAVAWIALGTGAPPPPPQRLYDMAIRPQEKRIIWYRVLDRLPEVRPAASAAQPERQPPRAARKSDQALAAGPKDDARAPRLVWAPTSEPVAPKPQPLPNLIAVEQRPLVKPFTPPAPKLVTPPAILPDAPPVAVAAKLAPVASVGPAMRPLVKPFAAPAPKPPAQKAAALPDAPAVSAKLGPAAAGPELKPLVKRFTPPAQKTAPVPEAALPDAPQAAQLAVVGPDPAKELDIPAPPPPSPGGFSAGPKPEPTADAPASPDAAVAVPGLTVRNGARDAQPTIVPRLGPPSMKNLLAGIRAAPPVPPGTAPPRAAHVATAPDPMLEGRLVYSIAIQMPNITSYSGSWLVWFAEHDAAPAAAPAAGGVRPPVPLRKVDPKYIAAAAAEGIEGIVRLGAIICRDGRVDRIRLLRHLDDRLDASAIEALGKWQFEPAVRNGAALDVDAVFEIPFRLAPKPSK